MRRVVSASLSLIGFMTTNALMPAGLCQANSVSTDKINVNRALPGASRKVVLPAAAQDRVNNSLGGQSGSQPSVVTPNLGAAGKLIAPGAGSQSVLNPGRLGDPLGGAINNINTAQEGLNQSITDITRVAPDPDTIKQQQRQQRLQQAQKDAGKALNAPDPVQQAQDNLTQVEAAQSLTVNPDKGTSGGTSNAGTAGQGATGAAQSEAADALGGSDPAQSGGTAGQGSAQDEAAGALGGDQPAGDSSQSGNSSSGSGSSSGSAGGGTSGKPDGDGSSSSSSGGGSIVDAPNLEGGSGPQQSAVSKLRGDALRGANGANASGQINDNLQSGLGNGILQNSGIEGRLQNRLNGGSQFNGQEVNTFSKEAPATGFRGGSPFAPGGKFSGIANPGGGANLPGGAVNNFNAGGRGVFTPVDLKNSAGGKLPGVANSGLQGAGSANVQRLPGVNTSAGTGGLPGAGAVKIPVGNFSPVSGLKPNLPSINNSGANTVKLIPNFGNANSGGSVQRGSTTTGGGARPPANSGRANIVVPARR